MRLKSLLVIILLITGMIACKKGVTTPDPIPDPPPANDTALQLTGHEFLIGNLERNIPDSFVLSFNKTVSVEYVISKLESCGALLQWEVSGDGKQVKFWNFLCSGVGGDYPFEFSVKDSKNKNLTDTIHFSAVEKRINTEGTVKSYWLTPDNKFVWVSVTSPNRILKIDIDNGAIVKQFDLDYAPARTTFNPYNGKIYVIKDWSDHQWPFKIYVIDPETGDEVKSIDLLPDQYDHPQNQKIFAYDIEFGANGLGVILIANSETTAMRWKMIDSRAGDSIYIHDEWLKFYHGMGNNYFNGFKEAHVNFDGSSINMLELYGVARLGEINCATGEIVERVPPPEGANYSSFVVPNKLNNDIYFGNLHNQYILSGSAFKGHISEFSILGILSADFSYRNDEENIVYLLVDNNFFILNYNNAKTMMSCILANELHDIVSTSDGKYIIAHGHQSINLFKSELFYRMVK